MDSQMIDWYKNIAVTYPGVDSIINDLKSPKLTFFSEEERCCKSVKLIKNVSGVETAFESLEKVLAAKGIRTADDGIPLEFSIVPGFGFEEYRVECSDAGAKITASDTEGMRRAVYFLEDRICEAPGELWRSGTWQRKPFVKHRISRCFFGPTYRPPFLIDELSNDIDYYPDNYLDKLAHEGINGLWLTMYFRDLPSSVLPHKGEKTAQRLKKLQWTVDRCARYGIRIYLFFSEPKGFGSHHHCIPESDAAEHPELMRQCAASRFFCTSQEAGQTYLRESVEQIFSQVRGLGGMINIMLGEDNAACTGALIYPWHYIDPCPVCTSRGAGVVFAEIASTMSKAMKKYEPDAAFIGWFYLPSSRTDSVAVQIMEETEKLWPEDCYLMLNFESGGTPEQLGKKRVVFDYSLAYVGPSQHYAAMTGRCRKTAAKLQVGCSHEDASVPFIPVPSNLYEKYRFLHDHHVEAVMQCWYFGNYPGLMNKAAGELSFEPFPKSEDEFLAHLAGPDGRKNAGLLAEAWKYFSAAYRCFPANICFEWYGPLHNSLTYVWHLYPADQPLAPTWLVKQFPAISGDRVGEALGYHHTLPEAIELVGKMDELWSAGIAKLDQFSADIPVCRRKDIDIAQAVALQIKSTLNMLKFYNLRENMFYLKEDNLERMRELVLSEITLTGEMEKRCAADPRLGYHSEAEAHLFHIGQLRARKKLLTSLLEEDFRTFDPEDPRIKEWTGEISTGKCAVAGKRYPIGDSGCFWQAELRGDDLVLEIERKEDLGFLIYIEPRRLWTPYWFRINADGSGEATNFICREMPDAGFKVNGSRVTVQVNLKTFEGFMFDGFPLRFNIIAVRGMEEIGAWGGNSPWPRRLTHGTYNPGDSGWLQL